MKDAPTLIWWYELGRAQAFGYRVRVVSQEALLTPEEFRTRQKTGTTDVRKRKRRAA